MVTGKPSTSAASGPVGVLLDGRAAGPAADFGPVRCVEPATSTAISTKSSSGRALAIRKAAGMQLRGDACSLLVGAVPAMFGDAASGVLGSVPGCSDSILQL